MKADIVSVFLFLILIGCNKSKVPIESVPLSDNHIEKIDFPENYQIQSIYLFQNHFVSYNNSSPEINVYDVEFNLKSTYRNSGFGPGEFQKIDSAVMTENRIIVYDSVKKAFEIFDRDFNTLGSLPTEHKIISLIAHNDGNIYAGALDMKQFYIIRFEGPIMENESILFVKDIDELLTGFHSLSIFNDNLFIANIMTNTGIILNLLNGKTDSIENPFMEKQPEFVYQGEYKLPKQPVWRAGFLTENHFFQIKNLDSGKAIIYRGNNDGLINKSFTFDEHIATIVTNEDQFWIFTGTHLIKYPLTFLTD